MIYVYVAHQETNDKNVRRLHVVTGYVKKDVELEYKAYINSTSNKVSDHVLKIDMSKRKFIYMLIAAYSQDGTYMKAVTYKSHAYPEITYYDITYTAEVL